MAPPGGRKELLIFSMRARSSMVVSHTGTGEVSKVKVGTKGEFHFPHQAPMFGVSHFTKHVHYSPGLYTISGTGEVSKVGLL